jgi:hypothetical protein
VTVKELIEKLQTLDQEMPVFINGYEGGYDDLTDLANIEVVKNVNTQWYYGSHEKIDDLHEDVLETSTKNGKLRVKGVIVK